MGYFPGPCNSIESLQVTTSQIIQEMMQQVNIKEKIEKLSTILEPSKNQKGSINQGGGGGGSGSGCGKKAPCDKSKKKTKSCGGGGGKCGKSKSCGGKSVNFKVCFKDFYGQIVKVNGQDTQDVAKDSTAVMPTPEEEKVPHPDTVVFNTWDPYPSPVDKDMECKSKWYDKITGDEVDSQSGIKKLVNEVSKEVGQKIQDFNDSYLNPGTSTKSIRSITEKGKFNKAIDKIIERIDYVTKLISDDMDILWAIKDTCYEGPDINPIFNDTKKCLLNIQSCFIFQCRMTFNLDFRQSRLVVEEYVDPVTGEIKTRNVDVRNPDVPDGTSECIYDRINRYTQEMLDFIRNGGDESEIDGKINNYTEELDEDIDFYLENNLIALNEFKESYNVYVDTINSCFPTDPLKKVEIEKI